MDDNHNQDGLNGLPLEPWMNQQHLSSLHPSFSTQVYNQPMSAQSIHDFMSHRALQTFSAVEPVPHIGQSSQTVPPSALQQFSLSSSTRLHQPEHLSASNERSAWSHLLSLDPSVAGMGSRMSEPQESLRHCLPQDTPRVVQNTRQDQLLLLKGNTKLTAPFDNTSLPKMHFSLPTSSMASIPLDGYSQMSTVNSQQNNISQQFTQHMNMSKKVVHASKPAVPKSLAISTDVPSLESSGSYSPVSPPAADIDQPHLSNSGQNSGRVAELFLRESHEIPSATFPLLSSLDQADIFNYISEKPDPFSSDIMQDSYSEPAHSLNVSVSNLLPSPSDVPLDMTTAFGSKVAKGISLKESSQNGAEVASSCDSITSDKSSLIQALLTKDQAHPVDVLNEVNTTHLTEKNQSQLTLHVTSDEKMIKPVKSTPKKSNFYGRDVSLFSFVPPTSLDSETLISSNKLSGDSAATELAENKNILNSSIDVPFDATCVQEQDELSHAPEKSTIITTGMKLSEDVHTNTSDANSVIFPVDTVTCDSSSSATLPVLGSITSQSHINNTIAESIDGTEPILKQNDNLLENEIAETCVSASDNFQIVLNSSDNNSDTVSIDKEHTEENKHWNQNFDIPSQNSEDFLAIPTTNKTKSTKRKKRKASGFQSKQRKKPVKKKLKIQQSDVFDNSIKSDDHSPDTDTQSAEVSELQDYENEAYLSETLPSKRKTRQLSKSKTSSSDLTPRRSSSRKSKANAMRLIELQADSNYSGISQSVDIVDKKTRKRKNRSSLSASELSGDSTEEYQSDEHDGDYVLDEDEMETLDRDEVLEQQTDKKVNTEKRIGGLKISIKLSGNSSAEIVSGIKDSRSKRKKTAKKKNVKVKGKDRVKIYKQQDDTAVVQENQHSSETGENVQESTMSAVSDKDEEAGASSDLKDRHMSLMEKYFSTANSATVARQTQKKAVSGKKSVAKKKSSDGTKSKLKSGTLGVKKQSELGEVGKQKASVKFVLESAVKKDKGTIQEDIETELPKFVCGYCPQRYHNKQDLLAHMEAHMVEMERKTDSEVTPTVDDNTKDKTATMNLSSSKPKLNRPSASPLSSSRVATSENITERDKLKITGDLDKDSDTQHVAAVVKQKFTCGECGQIFDSKPNLLDHVRIHTADKPFECDICHKCFAERNLLSAHRKTHGQEKLLRCQVCSKAFVHKADLSLHMQSHPRRSNTKSAAVLSIKKSFKKRVEEKHEEDDTSLSSKKPKSFASALTGEIDNSGKANDAPPLLFLTRRDGSSNEIKNNNSSGNKTILSEPKVVLKSVSTAVHKGNVTVKTNSLVKKPVENLQSNSIVKGDNSKVDSKNSSNVESSSNVKSSEVSASSVCTCKECPDCVTRFLQSFE